MSRLTFRDPSGDVAYQRQLRERYAAEGVPPMVRSLDLASSRVRAISRRLAEQIVFRYEWLGTMALTRWHYGLFFGDVCAGAVCFGVNLTSGAVYKRFEIDRRSLIFLARGACVHWAPTGANSRLVSRACRLLAADCPEAKIVVAYADSDAGEIGTIYQACNWTYTGLTVPTDQYVSPAGKVYDQKLITDIKRASRRQRIPQGDAVSWTAARDRLLATGWRTQVSNAKHRYVYILDRDDAALAARVESWRLPYPKRAGSIVDDASDHQSEEGGSIPTPALQQKGETE